MSTKTSAEVFIQPKNSRPIKRTATVHYSNPVELRRQIEAYAATVWKAKRIHVDTSSKEILIDGKPVANYALHIAGQPAPETPVVPTTPRRQRPRAAGRRYTRHTIAQTAVVAFGMILIIAAGDRINGLFIAGFAIAYFGIYRIAKGVTRREAAHRADRREIRTVSEINGTGQVAA